MDLEQIAETNVDQKAYPQLVTSFLNSNTMVSETLLVDDENIYKFFQNLEVIKYENFLPKQLTEEYNLLLQLT